MGYNTRHMCVRVRVYVCMYVCMIIISPYRLRHWLRLNDDKRLYYPMQGSIGQLNLQLSVSKSTLHRKHGESYFIRWRSCKGASCNIHHLHTHTAGACPYLYILIYLLSSLQRGAGVIRASDSDDDWQSDHYQSSN